MRVLKTMFIINACFVMYIHANWPMYPPDNINLKMSKYVSIRLYKLSLDLCRDAMVKYQVASKITGPYERNISFQLGLIAMSIKTLFNEMLELYSHNSNLSLFRYYDPYFKSQRIYLLLNGLHIAQSHYHRIRLERRLFEKLNWKKLTQNDQLVKQYKEQVGNLPQGTIPTGANAPALPAPLPKGGLHPFNRRSMTLYDPETMSAGVVSSLAPQINPKKKTLDVDRKQLANANVFKGKHTDRGASRRKLNAGSQTLDITIRSTKKPLWRPKINYE